MFAENAGERNASPEVNLPLAGLRVLDLGNMIAGPYCSHMLADFGAEVIKVELPSGDPLRGWRAQYKGMSLFWMILGRNKKTITLNLRHPTGQNIVRRLAACCDVVVENFSPGTMEGWGLGYEQLNTENPGLVMVRISGFGQTGPKKQAPGFASVAEAIAGLTYLTGSPNGSPSRTGVSLADSLAGIYGAFGAMVALHERQRTGHGQVVDMALTEGILSVLDDIIPAYDCLGLVRERAGGAIPGIAPSNNYPTSDSKWIVIGGNNNNVFRRLVGVLGRPELAEDVRYATDKARALHSEELDTLIGEWTRQHTLADLLERLQEASVPAAPINSATEVVNDPQFIDRQSIVRVPIEEDETVLMPGVVPQLVRTPGHISHAGRSVGADTEAVLTELLGASRDDIQKWREEKAI
ncbi:MAG TPA: CoA transferase [Ktedonobacteraceae bacterium]|jgi:crotonobetainyl-CoA:carnitine CoA-transferase CaiB-like acyl-CoA transferase